MKKDDIVVLTENGAFNTSSGERFGVKGQIARVRSSYSDVVCTIVLLTPRPHQSHMEYKIDSRRIKLL